MCIFGTIIYIMKAQRIKLLLFSFFVSSLCSAQKVDLETAMKQLDAVVAKRDVYMQNHRDEIDQLKKTLKTTTFDNDKYVICKRLYDEYQKFDADSALYYAHRCKELASDMKQSDLFTQAEIDELLISIYRGQYALAKVQLRDCGPIEKIAPNMQAKYAIAALEYYMRLQKFSLGDKTDPYSINIKLCWSKYGKYVPKGSWSYDYYNVMVLGNHAPERMRLSLKTVPQPSIMAAMIEVALAKSYHKDGNQTMYYYYLIHSAINDISMANCEAQSLIYLIESPYVDKDSKRAFDYAMVCTDNAKAYKDMGRSLDIVKAYSIISKAFESALERRATYMGIIIALLVLSLVVIFIELRLIIKKRGHQTEMMQRVEEMNIKLNELVKEGNLMRDQLKDNNIRLQDELKLRNNNFMNVYQLVSRYISDVQKYKRGIYNMLIAGKVDNAKKSLNSSTAVDEYLQDFYKQFDKAFMQLHPDFIDRFNELMKPDKKIIVPSAEVLTPELRIYALVSLGITESVNIADFLHYSPQTIYNYRLKVRHGSCIDEKEFADTIEKMYY